MNEVLSERDALRDEISELADNIDTGIDSYPMVSLVSDLEEVIEKAKRLDEKESSL